MSGRNNQQNKMAMAKNSHIKTYYIKNCWKKSIFGQNLDLKNTVEKFKLMKHKKATKARQGTINDIIKYLY